MTAAEFGVMLLRLGVQEFSPTDQRVLERILARAIQYHGADLVDRAGEAISSAPTDALVQELIRRGVDS